MNPSPRGYFPLISVFAILVISLVLPSITAIGQATGNGGNPQVDADIQPSGTFDGAHENVSLVSGDLSFCVPLLSLPGRHHHDLNIPLCYNSQFKEPSGNNLKDILSAFPWAWGSKTPYMGPGWTLTGRPVEYLGGALGSPVISMPNGTIYDYPESTVSGGTTVPAYAGDDSSFANTYLQENVAAGSVLYLPDGTQVVSTSSTTTSQPSSPFNSSFVYDTNGNYIEYEPTYIKDTVGRTVNVVTSATGSTASIAFQYPDSNGDMQTVTVQMVTQSYTCTEEGADGTYSMPTAIIYPDGLTYTFSYDGCGELTKITYPSGGYTRYVYTPVLQTFSMGGQFLVDQVSDKYECPAPAVAPGATSAASGNTCPVAENLTTYTPTMGALNNSQNIVIDPLGNKTIYQFSQQQSPGGQIAWPAPAVETSRQLYDASGKLWKTVNTQYNYTSSNDVDIPVLPTIQTTILDNGMESQIQWKYNYYPSDDGCCGPPAHLSEKLEYDYGTGAPGPLLRETSYTWLDEDNPAYGDLSNLYYSCSLATGNVYTFCGHYTHILDHKTSEIVYDGSGNKMAATYYEYDNYTDGRSASGTTVNADIGLDGAYPGNLTAVTHWRNTDGAMLTTRYQYDDVGNTVSKTDPNGNTTYYSYADNYAGGPGGTTTAAFLTKTTYPSANGVAHIAQSQYDWGSGKMAASCGENYSGACAAGASSGSDYTTYAYDMMGRLISASTGDGGQTTISYGGTYPLQTTTSELIAPPASGISITTDLAKVITATLDGLGRTVQSELISDPDGITYTSTTYDADGHVKTVSNPYRSTSDSTYGVTTYSYDGLDRVTQVTFPDASYATNTYTGRAVLSADEGNGTHRVQRISQTDALGRLTSVCEVTSTTQSGSSGTPASCGLDVSGTGFLTIYAYDALGDLTNVTQGGESRGFIYDSLGELKTATNPESGTTTYSYDNDGNVTGKTDALGKMTTYSYDNLNRLTGKMYSDGTASACFQYDSSNDGIGRMGVEWTQYGSCSSTPPTNAITERTFAAYDPVGRVTTDEQCASINNCGSVSPYILNYAYDLAGDVTSFNNGLTGASALSFISEYDPADHLNYIRGSESGGSAAPTLSSSEPVFTAGGYTPFGSIANAWIGDGIQIQRNYNQRLLPIAETDYSSANTPVSAVVDITGTEQSGGQTTGSFTFSGTEQSTVNSSSQTVYDIDVFYFFTTTKGTSNPPIVITGMGGSTPESLAAALAKAIPACSVSGEEYSAVAEGATVVLTSCQTGVQAEYPLIGYIDYHSFATASFAVTASGTTMTGAVNDSGTITLNVNGAQIASTTYGVGSTPTTIATALASSGSSNPYVTLQASNGSLTITDSNGATADYPYSLDITDTVGFSTPSFSVSSPSGTLTGGYGTPLYSWAISSYAPDGDVLAVTDSVMGTWQYTQDDMNRLVNAQATAGADTGMNLAWTYDRYGNRWSQTATGTGTATATQGTNTFSGNNNRIDGWSYDAAGNLLYDYIHHYTYDAENRIATIDGAPAYVYDAEGHRVAKVNASGAVTASYVLSLSGKPISEMNGAGVWVHTNVFLGNRLLATYAGPGDAASAGYHYHLTDWLGTKRMQTNALGAEEEVCYSYPFGDGLSCTGTDATEQHFTSKERDVETGLDYFGARYLSSNLGRWMTPDWAAAPTDVPFASFGDPQSLNLYAYVGNNPNTEIDADGHAGGSSGDAGDDEDNPGILEDLAQIAAEDGAAYDEAENTGISMASGAASGSSDKPKRPKKPTKPKPKDDGNKPPQNGGQGQQGNGSGQSQSSGQGQQSQSQQPKAQQPAPNNGTPPSTSQQFIAQDLQQYNQCVANGEVVLLHLSELHSVVSPDDYNAQGEEAQSNLDLQKSCLLQHPLADLSQQYTGALTAGAPQVAGIFSPNWF